MKAEQNEEGPKRAGKKRRKERAYGVGLVYRHHHDCGQSRINRFNDYSGQYCSKQKRDKRHKKQFQEVRQYFFQETLHIRSGPDSENDRKNRIGPFHNAKTERIYETCSDNHACKLIYLKFSGGRSPDKNRKIVKQAVGKKLHELIESVRFTIKTHMQQESLYSFQNAHCTEYADKRRKDAGKKFREPAEHASFPSAFLFEIDNTRQP